MNIIGKQSNNSGYHFLLNFDTGLSCFATGIELPIDFEAEALFFGFYLTAYYLMTIICLICLFSSYLFR